MEKKKNYEQELLEWQWEQIKLRKKYRTTPPGFQDKEMEHRVVWRWKEDVARFRKKCRHTLISSEIFSKEPFAGRDEELLLIKKSLEEQSGPVVLYGIGGIGKSALAREYIRRYGRPYDHILYLSFQTTLQNLISDDFDVCISNLQYDKDVYESKRKYFFAKYKLLKEIGEKGKLLVVIDDFNAERDRDMKEIFSLPCHMIVTTRRNPSVWGIHQGIHVEALRKDEWTDFVRCYHREEFTGGEWKDFEAYRKKVQGHTLLMQQKLKNPEENFSGIGEFQRDLFKRIPLKKEQKQAMTYLSIMPVQGIPRKMFLTISGVSEQTLDQLTGCILVQQVYSGSWQDEMLFLHPIIAKAAREIFQPSADNCRQLIRGFGDYLRGDEAEQGCAWDHIYRDNQKMESYVFAFIKAFPKPAPWLAEAFDELVTLLWIQGYYKEAEQYSKALYESVEEYYGECHQITGWMALRLGAVYHNSRSYEQSKEWYTRGVHILESCKPFNKNHPQWLASGYYKAARLLWHEGDMDGAKEAIDKGLAVQSGFLEGFEEITESLVIRNDRSMAYLLLEKGRILLHRGEIDEAERICQELFRKYSEKPVMERFRINEFTDFRIQVLMEKGNYEEAEACARDNMERALLYRGREWKDIQRGRKQLADILFLEGKMEEAQRLCDEIMGEIKELLRLISK